MRTAFTSTLSEIAKTNKNVWLITGDLGFSVFEEFREKFPNQYLNAGVAEQNMIGVAAGLALSGKTVFVYSIIPFITMRCLEQVRNDLCIQNANVKLVGVGEGFSYGQLGPSHHSIEDIAIMCSLPNMAVIAPGDPWEVEKATLAASKIQGPVYLRLGKKGEPVLHNQKDKFEIGKGCIIEKGSDLTIISTGSMLETAITVANSLKRENNLKADVISTHTLKPLDKTLILKSAKKTKAVFTIEEHNVIGGLGSMIAFVLAKSTLNFKFYPFGIEDKYTKMAGSQEYLRKVNGLSPYQIHAQIIKTLAN